MNNNAQANSETNDKSCHFSALLSPHRSLSAKGFSIMMALVSLVCFGMGLSFALMGAWPILGFFGLDVLLLYLAFRSSYRHGRVFETVELTQDNLCITHHPLQGEKKQWQFNPYWVKLNLRERRGKCCQVEASSHGKKLVFAHFLSDDEKREFTRTLNRALSHTKQHKY